MGFRRQQQALLVQFYQCLEKANVRQKQPLPIQYYKNEGINSESGDLSIDNNLGGRAGSHLS